jgi:hypothetical protein
MEAIKKKVQSMKVEKDNLCDRMDEVEQVRVHLKGTALRVDTGNCPDVTNIVVHLCKNVKLQKCHNQGREKSS